MASDPHADVAALLSGNLHRLMRERAVTLRGLSRAAGLPRSHVRSLLRFPHVGSIVNPTVRTVALLASALGVPVSRLFLPPPDHHDDHDL